MENKKDMKLLTVLITILFIYVDINWNIRNGIILAQLMFLILFYFGGLRATRTLRYQKQKRRCLQSGSGYRNPKEIKTWQKYKSGVEIKKESIFE